MEQVNRIVLTNITEKSGLLSRKLLKEDALVFFYTGGKVVLRQSAVEEAGDSWALTKRRIMEKARTHGVPCQQKV